jgi:hypothetical protein
MRLRFRTLAIVASRMRTALSGVGTASHRLWRYFPAILDLESDLGAEWLLELLSQAICEAVGDARPFAQFDDDRAPGSSASAELRRSDRRRGS